MREVLPDLTDLRVLLEFGFIPAQWSASFDMRSVEEIVRAAGSGMADPQVAALRGAFARLIMSDPRPEPWTILTYAFLHGSWTHVLLNSVWLVAFGSPVVRRAGSVRALILMVATAVAGAALHWVTNLSSVQPMIGASAVASGFMGAAVTFVFSPPRRPAPFGGASGPRPGPGSILTNRSAMIFIALWFVTNILFGLVAVPAGFKRGRRRLAGAYRRLRDGPRPVPLARSRSQIGRIARSLCLNRGATSRRIVQAADATAPASREDAIMSVERILAGKGRNVVTIEPDRTLGEATGILNRNRIGTAVVVGADGAVLGIISERDLVSAIAEGGGDVLREAVRDHMTNEVTSCPATAGVPELMELMTNGKFRHIPIVDGGRLGGIVSIGDLVKYRLAEVESEHQALRDYIATA